MAPVTIPVETFKAISGLNDRAARRLLAEGEIESVKIGKRRFVFLASYHAYLERLRVAQARYFPNSPEQSPG
jgi:hypothetical protein